MKQSTFWGIMILLLLCFSPLTTLAEVKPPDAHNMEIKLRPANDGKASYVVFGRFPNEKIKSVKQAWMDVFLGGSTKAQSTINITNQKGLFSFATIPIADLLAKEKKETGYDVYTHLRGTFNYNDTSKDKFTPPTGEVEVKNWTKIKATQQQLSDVKVEYKSKGISVTASTDRKGLWMLSLNTQPNQANNGTGYGKTQQKLAKSGKFFVNYGDFPKFNPTGPDPGPDPKFYLSLTFLEDYPNVVNANFPKQDKVTLKIDMCKDKKVIKRMPLKGNIDVGCGDKAGEKKPNKNNTSTHETEENPDKNNTSTHETEENPDKNNTSTHETSEHKPSESKTEENPTPKPKPTNNQIKMEVQGVFRNANLNVKAELQQKITGTWQVFQDGKEWDQKKKDTYEYKYKVDKNGLLTFTIPSSELTQNQHTLEIQFTGKVDNQTVTVKGKMLIKKKAQNGSTTTTGGDSSTNSTKENDSSTNGTKENDSSTNSTKENDSSTSSTKEKDSLTRDEKPTQDTQEKDSLTRDEKPTQDTQEKDSLTRETRDNEDLTYSTQNTSTTPIMGGPLPKTATTAPSGLLWGIFLIIFGYGTMRWLRRQHG